MKTTDFILPTPEEKHAAADDWIKKLEKVHLIPYDCCDEETKHLLDIFVSVSFCAGICYAEGRIIELNKTD